jgi:hypothetical protein
LEKLGFVGTRNTAGVIFHIGIWNILSKKDLVGVCHYGFGFGDCGKSPCSINIVTGGTPAPEIGEWRMNVPAILVAF